MIYPIYIYGSGVLRKECSDIDQSYPELPKLIEDMFATMYATNGVGLAAPQIGKDIRLEDGPATRNLWMNCEKAKKYPNIKMGICGEHGGDPSSVEFCHRVGLAYVSCSPFRVPIARLAAAQAAIKDMK